MRSERRESKLYRHKPHLYMYTHETCFCCLGVHESTHLIYLKALGHYITSDCY